MGGNLPNRQILVKAFFAYLAMAHPFHTGEICHMDKVRPNRIRELREQQGLTIEDMAERTAISVSYLSRLESGARNLSVKNIERIAAALSVDRAQILAKSGAPANAVIAVMGRIGAGAEILPEEEQVPPEGLYEIETMFPLPEDAIAFEVSGESMWPRYDDGDVIVCWRQGINAEEILGWEAAVRTSTGHRYLKRVLRGAEHGTFDLESHNAAPIRGVRIEWVAAVQSVIRSGQWQKLSPATRQKMVQKMTAGR